MNEGTTPGMAGSVNQLNIPALLPQKVVGKTRIPLNSAKHSEKVTVSLPSR